MALSNPNLKSVYVTAAKHIWQIPLGNDLISIYEISGSREKGKKNQPYNLTLKSRGLQNSMAKRKSSGQGLSKGCAVF